MGTRRKEYLDYRAFPFPALPARTGPFVRVRLPESEEIMPSVK